MCTTISFIYLLIDIYIFYFVKFKTIYNDEFGVNCIDFRFNVR
jgi:hypothetical protein